MRGFFSASRNVRISMDVLARAKVKHWRAFPRIICSKCPPVLEFDFSPSSARHRDKTDASPAAIQKPRPATIRPNPYFSTRIMLLHNCNNRELIGTRCWISRATAAILRPLESYCFIWFPSDVDMSRSATAVGGFPNHYLSNRTARSYFVCFRITRNRLNVLPELHHFN